MKDTQRDTDNEESLSSFSFRRLYGDIQAWLKQRAGLREVLGNTSWLALERLLNMTVRFLVSVWVVRYLGPEQYGVYSYALSFVGLFITFATLGLDNVVVRNLSSEKFSEGHVLGTAFRLRLASGLFTMLAVVAIVFSVSDRWITQLAVVIVSFQLVFKSLNVFDFWFQSEIKSRYPAWVRSAAALLLAGSQVAFILLEFSVLPFLALVVGQTLLQTVGIALAYRWVHPDSPAWRFDWDLAQRMMRDAWPLIFAGLSVSVYMKIDQVMIGRMISDSAVGVYATAAKVSELWYFIPTIVASSVFPKIVSMKEGADASVYRQRMQALYDAMSLGSYCVIVPLTLAAYPMMVFLFGKEYQLSAGILQVHIWSFLFVSLGVVRGRWLIAENFTRFAMIASMAGAVVNVAANLVLIPAYAGIGAAWATLLSQVVAAYVIGVFVDDIRISFHQMTKSIFFPFRIRSALRGILEAVRA